MTIIQRLHDSEINASIASFFDRCWTVKLGDELNGFDDEATVESFAEAEAWLSEKAREHYPRSTYAIEADTSLRDAALTFRCPEGFEALAAALGISDDTEARGKLDAAFQSIARAEFAAEVSA